MSDVAREIDGTVRVSNKPRGCGTMKEGGVYFYTAGSPFGTLPMAVLLDPPIPVDFGFFRGWRLIHPHAVDLLLPTVTWWAGTSAVREQERAMLAADLELFGMPWHERAGRGVCSSSSRRSEGRTQGVVVYRYRLPENTPLAGYDRARFLEQSPEAEFPWHLLPAGQAVHDAIARDELGVALALAWRAWWPLRWRSQVDVTFYRLLLVLAGESEALLVAQHIVERHETPAKYRALLDPAFCQAHGIEYNDVGEGLL